MSPEFEKLMEESDERNRHWIEVHKNDPCERCGATEGVTIEPSGNLAKLTPRCESCWKILREITDAYWKGYRHSAEDMKRRSLWERIFG